MTADKPSPPRWWAHPVLIPAAPGVAWSLIVLPAEHGWADAATVAVVIVAAALSVGAISSWTGKPSKRPSAPTPKS